MKIFRRTLHFQRSSENVIQTAFTIVEDDDIAAEIHFKNRPSPRTPPSTPNPNPSNSVTNTAASTKTEWVFNPFHTLRESVGKYTLAEISEPLYRSPSQSHSLPSHTLSVPPSGQQHISTAASDAPTAAAAATERGEVRGGERGGEGDNEPETTDVHLALAPSYQNTRFETKNAYTIVPVDQNYDLSNSAPEPHYSERIDCTKLGYVYYIYNLYYFVYTLHILLFILYTHTHHKHIIHHSITCIYTYTHTCAYAIYTSY